MYDSKNQVDIPVAEGMTASVHTHPWSNTDQSFSYRDRDLDLDERVNGYVVIPTEKIEWTTDGRKITTKENTVYKATYVEDRYGNREMKGHKGTFSPILKTDTEIGTVEAWAKKNIK